MAIQSQHRNSTSQEPSKIASQLQKQYAKQQRRKAPQGALPSPTLNIPPDDYTSFVSCLKTSTRILALFGAGLSAASGVPTFQGAGGFWRNHEATELAKPEAFEKNPSLLWQFYNYRRHCALKAKPNRAHVALAKLAEKKPDFLAISQNIDGETHLFVNEGWKLSDTKTWDRLIWTSTASTFLHRTNSRLAVRCKVQRPHMRLRLAG